MYSVNRGLLTFVFPWERAVLTIGTRGWLLATGAGMVAFAPAATAGNLAESLNAPYSNMAVFGMPGASIRNVGGTVGTSGSTISEGMYGTGALLSSDTISSSTTLNGNVYLCGVSGTSDCSLTKSGTVTGSTAYDDAGMASLFSAASFDAARLPTLTATQTFNGISSPTTINAGGSGTLNIIDISGNITNNITLDGTNPGDVFLINVTGSLSLTSGKSIVVGQSINVANVLWNFTNTSGTAINATHANNTLEGSFVAADGARINLRNGTLDGMLVGAGTLALAAAKLTADPFAVQVPEPSSLAVLAAGVGALATLVRRRRPDPPDRTRG